VLFHCAQRLPDAALGGCGRGPLLPRGGDLGASVAVPDHGDRCGVEEPCPVLLGPPSGAAPEVVAAQVLPGGTIVFAAEPSDDAVPRVVAQVGEGRFGYAVPEVGCPTSQRQVELVQEAGKRLVCSLSAYRFHFGFDGGQGLLRRPGVDVTFVRASLGLPLEAVRSIPSSAVLARSNTIIQPTSRGEASWRAKPFRCTENAPDPAAPFFTASTLRHRRWSV
jgi:hypothetical protein